MRTPEVLLVPEPLELAIHDCSITLAHLLNLAVRPTDKSLVGMDIPDDEFSWVLFVEGVDLVDHVLERHPKPTVPLATKY